MVIWHAYRLIAENTIFRLGVFVSLICLLYVTEEWIGKKVDDIYDIYIYIYIYIYIHTYIHVYMKFVFVFFVYCKTVATYTIDGHISFTFT